jgi:hypothetical protein
MFFLTPLLEDDLKEAASGCGGRGIPYGISIDFRLESLARSGFCQKYEVLHQPLASLLLLSLYLASRGTARC